MRRFFLLFILLICGFDRLPQVKPQEVRDLVEPILKLHVDTKKMDQALMERTLWSFATHLDPAHCYLTQGELEEMVKPKEALIAWNQADVAPFQAMYDRFVQSFERRRLLEKELVSQESDEKLLSDKKWPADVEKLKVRLAQIQFLQNKALAEVEEGRELLAKRRNQREQQFQEKDERFVASLILKACLAALDTHSCYFTPREAEEFACEVQQRFWGIGVQIRDSLDGVVVQRLIEGGAAKLSKEVDEGDHIVAIDGTPIAGLEVHAVVAMLRVKRDGPVGLTLLKKDGHREQIKLNRAEVVMTENRLEKKRVGNVLVLKLHSFYEDEKSSSTTDIAKALKEEPQSEGVLLDLRGNGGGLLVQAIDVTGLFVGPEPITGIKDDRGKIQILRSERRRLFHGPMVILIDRFSASASEIVAQVLKDYGHAIIVGDRQTYGKGTCQLMSLDPSKAVQPHGEFKITIGRYYTPSGNSVQLVGARSDVVIPGPYSKEEVGEAFAKYPLSSDNIASFRRFYTDRYQKHIAVLEKNSAERIAASTKWQAFLIKPEGEEDIQEAEAIAVLNDLISLDRTS